MAAPTYVMTLPLKVGTWQEHILEKRLNIGRHIYNACLGEARRRYKYMIRNPGLDVRVETMNFKGLQAKAKKTEISEKTGMRSQALTLEIPSYASPPIIRECTAIRSYSRLLPVHIITQNSESLTYKLHLLLHQLYILLLYKQLCTHLLGYNRTYLCIRTREELS
ncbi:hypothetical protein J9303_20595 [Bacillaceae bacterium Marseille-Q3522]|nr:hypothetical protein [Bacillaceae bacterium Marseille-Q3522]